ncbi:MAG TPA: DinB family protein [Candidatus Eisenbacteria bacterium]
MNLIDHFQCTWDARERMLDACESLTAEEWAREFPFSWRSIRNLVAHIVEVEDSWIRADVEGNPWESPSREEVVRRFATPALARARGREVAAHTRQVLERFVPARLAERRGATDRDGAAAEFTVEQILTHVYTHELRHQGQLQAMFRLLGREKAPNLDWI